MSIGVSKIRFDHYGLLIVGYGVFLLAQILLGGPQVEMGQSVVRHYANRPFIMLNRLFLLAHFYVGKA